MRPRDTAPLAIGGRTGGALGVPPRTLTRKGLMEEATACARTWESPRVGDSGAEPPVQLEPLRDPPSPGDGGGGRGSLPEAKAERGLRGQAPPSRPIPVCKEKGKKKC